MAAKIKVPKTPKRSIDPTRPPSELLLRQIEHLEWAVLPAAQRKPQQLPKSKPKTEAQAAERVGQLTRMLREASAARAREPLPPPAEARVILPPVPSDPSKATAATRRRRPKLRSAPRRRKTAVRRANPRTRRR